MQLTCNQLLQICFEIPQKQLVILPGQQLQNVIVIVLQMPEQMEKHPIRRVAGKNMSVVDMNITYRVKNMAEKLLSKLFEQELLCFKMGIEGRSAHIRPLDDLTHGDLSEFLLG